MEKNPPCVNAIKAAHFRRVIIGVKDPNPLVSGKGIEFLKKSNIEVVVKEHKECLELHKYFFINYI